MGKPWPPRGPDDLDDLQRARMRREVLAKVDVRGPGLGDHAYAVLSVLAAPAPLIVRSFIAVILVGSLVATATVASADALPDEPLYGVKVASEQVRLGLARSPEDRAAVWLSMAEHRLGEAERLALAGREPEALVAASAYGTQLAEAAAELAAIERLENSGPGVVARLRTRLEHQQRRALDIAERLRSGTLNARSAPAFDPIASGPPPQGSGTLSERIAEHAASVTDQVAAIAEQRAVDAATAEEPAAEPPPEAAAAPAPKPEERPAAAPRQAPAGGQGARPPAGIGAVSVPGATPAGGGADDDARDQNEDDDEGRREEASKREESARAGRGPDESAAAERKKRLEQVYDEFKKAIEQIKQRQKEAREAWEKAKERGKKTPPPAKNNDERVKDQGSAGGKAKADKKGDD